MYKCLPVETLKDALAYLHVDCGIAWLPIIIAAPWVTKAFVVLPLTIRLQKYMEKIAPTQAEATQKMKVTPPQKLSCHVKCAEKSLSRVVPKVSSSAALPFHF